MTSLHEYAEQHTAPEDALLAELARYTHLHAMYPRMLSGHIQGKLLEHIACMIRPQRILEIGTFTGYSALCLVKGLAPDGILHSIERNDEVHETAASFIARSVYAKNIRLHVGDALDIIPTLDECFDLIYIDGDKWEYCDYYRSVFDKLRTGGFLLADNVLWDGKVVNPSASSDKATKGILAFNKLVQEDLRVDNLLLPLRDGLMIIKKRF